MFSLKLNIQSRNNTPIAVVDAVAVEGIAVVEDVAREVISVIVGRTQPPPAARANYTLRIYSSSLGILCGSSDTGITFSTCIKCSKAILFFSGFLLTKQEDFVFGVDTGIRIIFLNFSPTKGTFLGVVYSSLSNTLQSFVCKSCL